MRVRKGWVVIAAGIAAVTVLVCLTRAANEVALIEGVLFVVAGSLFAWALSRASRAAVNDLENLVRHSPDGMLLVDDEGLIARANNLILDVTGYRSDELEGQPVGILIPDAARAHHGRHLRDYFRHPSVRSMGGGLELRGRRKDGLEFPAEVSLNPVRYRGRTWVLCSLRELGARSRLRKEMEDIIELLPLGVLIGRGDRLLYTNAAFAACLGYSREEVLTRPLSSLVDPADAEAVKARIAIMEASGAPTLPVERRYVHKDGHFVRFVIRPLAMVSYRGEAARLTVTQDVTEQRQLEAKLLIADRHASLGTLAAGIAHEINNPLSFIIGNLSFLAAELGSLNLPRETLEDYQSALHDAKEGADRIRTIVRGVKTFSRTDDEVRGACDVHKAIEASIQMACNEIKHRATLVRELQPVPDVIGNEGKLGQVVLNLLLNAAQAIPEGRSSSNAITVRTLCDGGQVVIEVEDTGSGISPRNLERIFTPFFTTKPVGVGTGLGLAISQATVKDMQGDITVRSTEGRGTTFRVRLPAAAGVPTAAPTAPKFAPATSLRLLVVDDESLILQTVQRFTKGRCTLVCASSAAQALRHLEEDPHFDGILCDLMMPDITGPEFYDRVRQRWPELLPRFVFMSGGTFTSSASEFLEHVPNPRLEKPFDLQELEAKLNGLQREARREV